ncbi:MAG TPA: hypothetical protein VG319_04475 [Polyangia bacterium]|nr:hypothetical protein [Polyangia bacterium]
MHASSTWTLLLGALTLGGAACSSPRGSTGAGSGLAGTRGGGGESAATGGAGASGAAGTGASAGSTGAAGATLDAAAGSSGASGTGASGADASSGDGGGATDATPAPTDGGADVGSGAPPGKQVLVWVWQSYATSLAGIAAHAKSFTDVSPALYQINYAYQSGVAKLVNANDNFDGLTSKQVTEKIHAAGLKSVPLMYGGAGNFGTDQGIQNVLDDAPAGARQAFIDAMVGEAVAKGHDGYNLDWEVGNTGYAAYGAKLLSFLAAFRSALNAKGMTVSLDLGGWYVRQCTGAGSDGLVDLAQMGHSVDLAIIEDYSGSLGNQAGTCPASNPKQQSCDGSFLTQLGIMCNLPRDVASIGVISPGTNPFAADALSAVSRFGFTRVAVWPDASQFLDASNMPAGATWYSVLADWLAK